MEPSIVVQEIVSRSVLSWPLWTHSREPTRSGKASVRGFDVVEDRLSVQPVIGFGPEIVRRFDSLTAAENLRFFARVSGVAEAGVE